MRFFQPSCWLSLTRCRSGQEFCVCFSPEKDQVEAGLAVPAAVSWVIPRQLRWRAEMQCKSLNETAVKKRRKLKTAFRLKLLARLHKAVEARNFWCARPRAGPLPCLTGPQSSGHASKWGNGLWHLTAEWWIMMELFRQVASTSTICFWAEASRSFGVRAWHQDPTSSWICFAYQGFKTYRTPTTLRSVCRVSTSSTDPCGQLGFDRTLQAAFTPICPCSILFSYWFILALTRVLTIAENMFPCFG